MYVFIFVCMHMKRKYTYIIYVKDICMQNTYIHKTTCIYIYVHLCVYIYTIYRYIVLQDMIWGDGREATHC